MRKGRASQIREISKQRRAAPSLGTVLQTWASSRKPTGAWISRWQASRGCRCLGGLPCARSFGAKSCLRPQRLHEKRSGTTPQM